VEKPVVSGMKGVVFRRRGVEWMNSDENLLGEGC
jgi:hypothetical protein